MFDALEQWFGNAEIRVLAHLERLINNRFNRLEKRMSAQTEAFKVALANLSTGLTTKLGEMQAKIDAAVSAQAAKDDAAFKDATDQLTALTASLGDHVDAINQTASAAIGDAAGGAPVVGPAVADAPVSGAPTPFQAEAENAEDEVAVAASAKAKS